MIRGLAVALLCLGFTAAAQERDLLVFAAASTAEAVTEVTHRFEAGHRGAAVRTSFAGTNELVRQLQAGAKGDVLLSADDEAPARVRAREHVALLSNTLVVVVPVASKLTALTPRELPSLRRIAVADPLSVPAGRYAQRWLERQALWGAVQDRLIPSLDVRAALAAAESGRVDAAVVYATDAARSQKVREVLRVRAEDAPPIIYSLALVSQRADARALYRFMKGPEAAAVFRRHGFVVK